MAKEPNTTKTNQTKITEFYDLTKIEAWIIKFLNVNGKRPRKTWIKRLFEKLMEVFNLTPELAIGTIRELLKKCLKMDYRDELFHRDNDNYFNIGFEYLARYPDKRITDFYNRIKQQEVKENGET